MRIEEAIATLNIDAEHVAFDTAEVKLSKQAQRFIDAVKVVTQALEFPPVCTPCSEGMPTTGEIVRALLNRSVDKKSFYRRKIELIAADRLKTQERDIEWMSKKFDEVYKTWRESDSVFLEKIAALTARSEQAEKKCDELVNELWEFRNEYADDV